MKKQVAMDTTTPCNGRSILEAAAFTLIEMIGVLAIIVILASAATPAVIREIDRAAWTKEASDMGAISNALALQILRSYSIPGTNNWATSVGTWLNQPVTNITSNNRNFNRLYLVDPSSTLALPYTQSGNAGLSGLPASARVMIVSTIARMNVPTSINFNETWNWNQVLNPTNKPASWSSFTGTGDDVFIQRINLGSMFYRLILVNRDQQPPGCTNAPFNINGTLPVAVVTNLSFSNGSIWNKYYLAGSTLGLWATNGSIATSFILNQDSSFVFENGTWNAQIQNCAGCTNAPPPPSSALASAYNSAAINFFNSLWNSGAGGPGAKGATQTAVLSAFGNFMTDYVMWAEATSNGVAMPFNSNGVGNKSGQLPIWQIINNEEGNVNTFTGTGNGVNSGLLK